MSGYLAAKHAHPKDKKITFRDEGHVYAVDWLDNGELSSRDVVSVSGLYKGYFKEFDADSVIKRMMASRKWSTSKYFGMTPKQIKDSWRQIASTASRNGTEHHFMAEVHYDREPTENVTVDRTVDDHHGDGTPGNTTKPLLRKRTLREISTDAAPPDTPPLTRRKLAYAVDSDSSVCVRVAAYRESHPIASRQFDEFANDHRHLISYRTEWLLWTSAQYKVCGSPDMLFVSQDHDDSQHEVLLLDMYDWKNCKEIKSSAYENGYEPFEHLPNSNYGHYSVQLNVYAYILENFYFGVLYNGVTYKTVQIDKMYLICMHDTRDAYQKIAVEPCRSRIKQIFEERAANLLNKTK